MEYAVFMFAFGKPHYAVAACINAFIQRKLINKINSISLYSIQDFLLEFFKMIKQVALA